MTNPSVTYTFTNDSTSDATQVNANFVDIIDAMTDGTKSFSIAALTVGGTATFNGAVNLGNATSDDISINGYVATDFLPKTTNTYDIGASGRVMAEVHSTKVVTTTIDAISTAGVAIEGSTNGSSASAGCLGELQVATDSNNRNQSSPNAISGNTNWYCSAAAATLTAGNYLVVCTIPVAAEWASGASSLVLIRVCLYDTTSSAMVMDAAAGLLGDPTTADSFMKIMQKTVTLIYPVTISGSNSYDLRAGYTSLSGSPVMSSISIRGDRGNCSLRAIRIS